MTRIFLRGLPPDVKIRNTRREEPVCPDEPQKGLSILAKSSKNTLVTSPAKRPRIPAKKVLKQTQDLVPIFP
jgi:hypothetical protein